MDDKRVLLVLLYAYPLSVWAVLLSSSLVQRGFGRSDPDVKDTPKRPWRIIGILQAMLACCFVVSASLNISPYMSAAFEHDVDRLAEARVVRYFCAGQLPRPLSFP